MRGITTVVLAVLAAIGGGVGVVIADGAAAGDGVEIMVEMLGGAAAGIAAMPGTNDARF